MNILYVMIAGIILINLSILLSAGFISCLFSSGLSCLMFGFFYQMHKDLRR